MTAWLRPLFFTVMGAAFGFVLSRSGASDYNFIQGMFLFTELQLYGIIGVAVAVSAPGLWLYKRLGRGLLGQPLSFAPKPAHRGNVIGGVLFGIGWSLTGMCPGPILVNIGEGKLYALAAFAGALCGAYAFGSQYERLRPRLQLPAVDEGTGCG